MTTYTQLQTDVPLWLKRTDIESALPGLVALFEARAGRKLRTAQMEAAFSGTITNSRIALPADFQAFKTLYQPGYQGTPIRPQSLESVLAKNRSSGTPTMYAVEKGFVRFDGSGDIVGVYHAKIPGLVANGSNWLSTLAYDAYLFGVLAEAELYSLNTQGAAGYVARSEMILSEIASVDMRDRFTGPLVARTR